MKLRLDFKMIRTDLQKSLVLVSFLTLYLTPCCQTTSLVYNSFTRQTRSGIIQQDAVIGTFMMRKRIQCAILCSQLSDCVLYSVQFQSGAKLYTCHFANDVLWTHDVTEGAAIYRHAFREPAPETTTSTTQEVSTLPPCICYNGGTCSYVGNTPVCQCAQGYSGQQCDKEITEPPAEITTLAPCICYNGGTCSYTGNSPVCVCPQIYEGTQCETQITECSEPPSSGISTSNSNYQVTIINQASEKIHVYRKGSSDLVQAISEGGGEWSAEDIKVGSRIYFMNENKNKYIPMQISDGTWYCWIDLPSNTETLTARDSIS